MEFPLSLEEVTQRTRSLSQRRSENTSPSGFRRFGIRVPDVRKILKQDYTFCDLPPELVVRHWDYIWNNSPWYEVAHQALYYYQHKTISKVEFNKIKTWVNRCDCWEHSDDLSKIYAQIVEDDHEWLIPLYEKWNRAGSPWKRRQSVVGLIEYASKRKTVLPFNELIRFVEPLLADHDYYVQKGVGWTLREIFNVYPNEATLFLKQNVLLLTPIAFSSATEKLDKGIRQMLKEKRKKRKV
jgi:3-methyladenine DNA glycosylase AlkD